MNEVKITRKLLDEYRDMRKKRTIPILEMELREISRISRSRISSLI